MARRGVIGLIAAALVAVCSRGAAAAEGFALPGPDELTLQGPPPSSSQPLMASDLVASADASVLSDMSLEDLMNVEVTSVSRTRQRMADTPAAVTVITQEDIRHSGLHEIPEILRLAPGIFVQHSNQLTHWSVASRGFADIFANKLLVLQDGRTVYIPWTSGVYWDMVDYPIPDLDRIEVIRGPGATLWGANAVNGVINITSKSARDTQGAMIDSRVGTDTSDLALRYGGKIDGETYYRIYGKGRAFDDGKLADGSDAKDQWQDARSGFRIDRFGSDKDTLTLQGDATYQSFSNDMVPGVFVPNYTHDYHNGANVLGRWTHVESDTSDFAVQSYWDRVHFRDPFVDYTLDTYDVDFHHRFELARIHEIMYGVGGRVQHDNVGSFFLAAPMVDPDTRTTYLLSAFVQDTIAVVPDRLHLIVGSKFEYNSFTGFEFQPSVRGMWTPNADNSVWAAVSRAVRTPSRWHEDANFSFPAAPGTTVRITSADGNIDSESLLAYEVGYRHQINKSFSVDLTGFVNQYDDIITLRALPVELLPGGGGVIVPSEWDNGQSAETYGTEVSANWQVTHDWRLAGSYSLLLAYAHNNSSDFRQQLEPAIEDSTPTNMVQLHSYLDLPRNIELNASAYYYEGVGPGGITVPGTPPGVKSYIRADFNITWRPKPDMELSLGVENAFDPQHMEASSGMGANSEVRRAVYGQFTWRF